jgi:hypothetical protein
MVFASLAIQRFSRYAGLTLQDIIKDHCYLSRALTSKELQDAQAAI